MIKTHNNCIRAIKTGTKRRRVFCGNGNIGREIKRPGDVTDCKYWVGRMSYE